MVVGVMTMSERVSDSRLTSESCPTRDSVTPEVTVFHLSCLFPHQYMCKMRGKQMTEYRWSLCPDVVGERLCTSISRKTWGTS
jgi:hypothetical protein